MALLVRPARADDAPPHTVSAPVHGGWTAINSPATRVPSHGVRTLGQAFAIDILHPSGGVAAGMSITAGQKIGEVGNTGNTSGHHIHFQLMDRARPAHAAGLPFRWSDITIEPDPDPRWSTAKKAAAIIDRLPGTGQTFHTTGEGGT